MSIAKNGSPIRTLEAWFDLAPPKSRNHWRNGRSAKEAAIAERRVGEALHLPELPRAKAAGARGAGSVEGQFGNISWTDTDRDHKHITEDIPARVAADVAYQNAKKNNDKQNARIEHDKALARVMTAVLKDDTELFKQFMDNESFKRWLTDTVFGLTYDQPAPAR
jgi:hypothetical protein